LLIFASVGMPLKLTQTNQQRHTSSVSESYLQTGCYEHFMDYLNEPISNKDEALVTDDLYDLAIRLCIQSLTTVKTEYKPYQCTFSSIFSFFYISEHADSTNVKDFAADYCSNLNNIENDKITLLSKLSSIPISERTYNDFYTECLDEVGNYTSNSWIDPIIPNPSITLGNICINLATLFFQMSNSSLFEDSSG